ncbi:MAG: hypothetical protein JXR12_06460 [Neptunomonas phycophila]|uniref:hypothetical protein n=1 Tax=Neptunomonas phycophila TaxID=1572645 RepID=UPI003B8AF944
MKDYKPNVARAIRKREREKGIYRQDIDDRINAKLKQNRTHGVIMIVAVCMIVGGYAAMANCFF